jgi:hypothetical protein
MAVQEKNLLTFFQQTYRYDEGYICIATTRPPARRDTFQEQFFKWPEEYADMVEYIDRVTPTHNVYFCINVMSVPRRKKENAIPQNLVWADLDTCNPQRVEIPPQTVIESSPSRFQAIWKLDRKVDPLIAESYSKRIAYAYADQGADKTGHDLTQLLRVPGTFNFKYDLGDIPTVILVADIDQELTPDVFEALPIPDGSSIELPDIALPELEELPSYEMIVYRYEEQLQLHGLANTFARYVGEEPPEDWSGHLWRLILLCFEAGMTAEETFVIAKNAKCNKYERDARPDSHLWREVLKAELERKSVEILLRDHRYLSMPALLSAKEHESLPNTLIDDYLKWATEVTDAVPDFHEISCAMLMSAFMATTLRLQTSRSQPIVPNLWALILGESTLTRKTTAMDMAMDFVMDIDQDLIVASDASMEGLMTNLALRPKMASIFYRDEISGFFDSMQRKDYLAGMHEALTKMYDVPKMLKRTLKKDTYVISEPIFMLFGGGITNKLYSLVNDDYYASGFIPRFLVVQGRADLTKIRPTGPRLPILQDKRATLQSTFQAFYTMYTNCQMSMQTHDGQHMLFTPEFEVTFTKEMWERAALMENQLLNAASNSPESDKALPTFSRMFGSILKLTMLFAGSRQEPKRMKIKATMDDLLCAAHYVERWGKHSVELIRNSNATAEESKLMACYRTVETFPGVLRSELMQKHRINARDMQIIEDTLVQRAMIEVTKRGKFKNYWPLGR